MNASNGTTEQSLLAALDGDRGAQQIVFSEYYDLIASVAWKAWPSDLRAVLGQDDLVQDVMARLLQKLHTFDRSRVAEFPGWLKKLAMSEVLDKVAYWRAFGHGRIHSTGEHANSDLSTGNFLERHQVTHSLPEKPLRREEAKEALQSATAGLPDDQREAIHRKYFLGETHAEIAKAMRRSPGAVRELLRRAEARLEEEMGTQSRWLSSR